MYRISKTFRFEAAHTLDGLPDDHKCRRMHGHNYRVVVQLVGQELTAREGWLVDFADLNPFGRYLKETCDHRYLNEVYPELGGQTTAERLAQLFFAKVPVILDLPPGIGVRFVEVWETDDAMAAFVTD